MKVYLNGRILDQDEAKVSVFDRGFLFGDGVYETIRYFDGVGVMMSAHQRRLARSMELTGISGFAPDHLGSLGEQLLESNRLWDAGVYWQVTRGVEAKRSHAPQTDSMEPTVFGFAWELSSFGETKGTIAEVSAILRPDVRWMRCDIKSVGLLPNILAQMEAERCGAVEAILHRGKFISEGASSNVCVVSNGKLITPPLNEQATSGSILAGTTRELLFECAGMPVEVRLLSVEEFSEASEIIIVSSTKLLRAVVRVDDRVIGDGTAGPVCRSLHQGMMSAIENQIRGK